MTDVIRSLDAAVAGGRHPGAREIVLAEEPAANWIRVLNDARLAVGTALGGHGRVGLRDARADRAELRDARAVRLDDGVARRAARRFRRLVVTADREGPWVLYPGGRMQLPQVPDPAGARDRARWRPSSSTRSRARCVAPPTPSASRSSRCSRAATSWSRGCPAPARPCSPSRWPPRSAAATAGCSARPISAARRRHRHLGLRPRDGGLGLPPRADLRERRARRRGEPRRRRARRPRCSSRWRNAR